MGRKTAIFIISAILLLGLPLAGVTLAGKDVGTYLEFPPLTRYVRHAGFSWPIFIVILFLDLALSAGLLFVVIKGFRNTGRPESASRSRRPFPWWGWFGMGFCALGWTLAWTRFTWFAPFQQHTFVLPWLGYILTVNALCQRRSGSCPILESPGAFMLLFPVSALFWWFFEFLNRFVQNWYYIGLEDFSAFEYVLFATLAFATVLPAVISTTRLLLTYDIFNHRLTRVLPLTVPHPKAAAGIVMAIAAAGLTGIGLQPDILFPLLWVSPLILLTGLHVLSGRPSPFGAVGRGDWRAVIAPALAALICGFFWEMWNFYSLAKWKYAIPYVDRYLIFEMPVLGYGGYLPFGLECWLIWRIVLRIGHLNDSSSVADNMVNDGTFTAPYVSR